MTRILILLAGLLVVGESFALPPCPTSEYEEKIYSFVGRDNCFGVYNPVGPTKYVGEWKDDKYHGQGTLKSDPGHLGIVKYVGEFKDGKYHGQGTLMDGDEFVWFVGEFKDGLIYKGTSRWRDGTKYVGGWAPSECYEDGYCRSYEREIVKHGLGVYTYRDTYSQVYGKKVVGEWRRNKIWEGVQYSPAGEVIATYSQNRRCNGCKPTSRHLAIVRAIDPTQIAAAPQKSTLTVKSNLTNANVYIDDKYKGKTELKIQLVHGYYSIRVSTNGYNNFSQRIELDKNMVLWASLSKKEKPKPESGRKLIGTGTGFVVNKHYVVTAEHVLEDCNAVSIRHGNREIDAQTAARDASNDLGLIRLQKPIGNTAKLRGGKRVRLGEMVANYGYPLFGQLSTSATITEGNINNLSAVGNDSTMFQFDAPTQPGNSGGPLLDSSGNVVGVAIKILSKKYADATGHIAQNVNFAIKSTILEGFLKANKVPFEKADSTEKLELPDIAEKAEAFTVLVGCWE
jgi:S1-C subfamily serine protease